jgi:heparan-alpha-glucosaminide N-acetyltransferase
VFKYENFGECGQFKYDISNCNMKILVEPNKIIILYIGIPIIIILIIFSNLYERYHLNVKKYVKKLINKSIFYDPESRSNKIDTVDLENRNNEKTETKDKTEKSKFSKPRYQSLDAFRGLSILIMIFVNYGYNSFKFYHHVIWNGFNLASLVFPWFLWIMGLAVPIAINSQLKKQNPNRYRIFIKILWRTIRLFIIGLILNINYEWSFSTLRYFGVLQRIALSYLVVATIELIFWKRPNREKYANTWMYYIYDLIYSIPHTIVVSIILLIWFLVVYLLPVPNCPTGYLGAGGLENRGKYKNCTGGATSYIDNLLLGKDHLYIYPTSIIVYKTENYEPEGILGTLTSIVLVYFGVIIGRVILFYKEKSTQLIHFTVWFLITFVLFACLTQFDVEDGLIPVNKNIWTYTFTLICACTATFIFIILYVIIDLKQFWNGNPFIYVGCNSLFIYVCHYLFINQFPVQWYVPKFHSNVFLMCIWGCTFWTGN